MNVRKGRQERYFALGMRETDREGERGRESDR